MTEQTPPDPSGSIGGEEAPGASEDTAGASDGEGDAGTGEVVAAAETVPASQALDSESDAAPSEHGAPVAPPAAPAAAPTAPAASPAALPTTPAPPTAPTAAPTALPTTPAPPTAPTAAPTAPAPATAPAPPTTATAPTAAPTAPAAKRAAAARKARAAGSSRAVSSSRSGSARAAGSSRAVGTGRSGASKRSGATAARAASPASASPAAASEEAGAAPAHPATLAIDIGGTGLKASVLDAEGRLLADRVRVPTTYPVAPEEMVNQIAKLVQPLPAADRASAGFPGVVRRGHVLTAPHFVTKSGPGSRIVKDLVTKWTGYDLAGSLASRLGIPVRVANDADLQGWAVISGHGIEMVITLGTGVGSALFAEGKLAPHLELAHHPFRKGETYNEQIGEDALKRIGTAKWRRRVVEAIGNFEELVNYDRLYLGGGNGRHMRGHVPPSVTIVDNVAGIVGGIKLWEHGGH